MHVFREFLGNFRDFHFKGNIAQWGITIGHYEFWILNSQNLYLQTDFDK